MAKTDSTKILWQVQVRRGPGCKWQNKGRFETRKAARERAKMLRYVHWAERGELTNSAWATALGYGFGNTRVIRHIRGEKK